MALRSSKNSLDRCIPLMVAVFLLFAFLLIIKTDTATAIPAGWDY